MGVNNFIVLFVSLWGIGVRGEVGESFFLFGCMSGYGWCGDCVSGVRSFGVLGTSSHGSWWCIWGYPESEFLCLQKSRPMSRYPGTFSSQDHSLYRVKGAL